MHAIINALHWFDVRVFRNGDVYRRWFVEQGFFTAYEWSDDDVLNYLRRG